MKIDVKLIKTDVFINESVELSHLIKENHDILDILETNVMGKLSLHNDILKFDGEVSSKLVLTCAKTLKPVNYDLVFPLELRFSNDELGDYPLDAVIDFSEIIYANIVVEKPYVVYHEDSLNEVVEEKREVHPAFMDLEDLIKK